MQWDREMPLEDMAMKEEYKELQVWRSLPRDCVLRVQEESCSLRGPFQQLKRDFLFNLEILDEQNKELERYDALIVRALKVEHNRQAELNQLQAQISILEGQKFQEATEHNSQLHELKCQAAKYKHLKGILPHEIRCVKAGLEKQREEMARTLEDKPKMQQHEFHKEKQLHQEAEIYTKAHLQAVEALKESKVRRQALQTQLQHKVQQIMEVIRVKDSRLKELESQLNLRKIQHMEMKNDVKRHKDEVWALKKREAHLEAQCQAFTEQIHKSQEHILDLQHKMDDLAARTRCAQEEQQKATEKRDAFIQGLQSEIIRTRSDWDSYIQNVCKDMVAKDTEIISLQTKANTLSSELQQERELSESYKKQLSAGLKREKELERMRVQTELEWQRRCEDTKAELYLRNEQLIQDLTQAKDQALTDLKEKEAEVRDLTVLYESVRSEQDQAKQGLTPENVTKSLGELKRVQEQNDTLRTVITQMSKQMESLSCLPHPNSAEPRANPSEPSDRLSIPPSADAQTPNQQPTTSQESVAKPNPADEHTRHNALKEKVKVTQAQPPHSSSIPQLSENNPPLQQPAPSQKLCRQFENIQLSRRRDTSLLHARLKQAAGCIVRLSKDKQQLIEMGNRLRAQITSGESQVTPERNPSPKTLGLQCDRPYLLEQPQQQLTTQKLKGLLKKMTVPVTDKLQPQTNQKGPLTADSVVISQQHHSSENSNQKGGSRPSHISSLSSDESLQELWDLMDTGLGPSMLSDGDIELARGLGVETAKRGGASLSRQPLDFRKRDLHKSQLKTRMPATNRRTKIRNYNIKD